MKYLIMTVLLSASLPAWADNTATKACLNQTGYSIENFDTFDWNKAAACASKARQEKREAELAELRDFLKHNPRYRVPGQSLNRCWGKPREMPFESSYIKVTGNSFEAGVNYKDKLPAGCYENAPWDNRDAKK
jgi:hypothetical protein